MARRPREARGSLFLRDHRPVGPSGRHRDADGDPTRHARDRGRQYPLFAGVAAHAARNRGAVSARALRLRDARLPALRMEVQCAQRRLPPGRLALRLRLRGYSARAHDHQEPQPRHGVLLHARQRMAGAQGCLRALARGREFRRTGTAAGKLERVERRALDTARGAGPAKAGRGFRALPLQGAEDVHILITGAAGMIGRKLAQRLARDGGLNGQRIDKVTLLDVVPPIKVLNFTGQMEIVAADLSAPSEAARTVEARPDTIFHLAGVVSGEAELDFDKGYRVNLDGTRALLEAIRPTGDGYRPRLVYTSSIAVFGAPFPPSIPDDFHLTPLTSYGTQKAIGEALIADYTRRGFCDGVGIRLPSIVVRPGTPNKAASGFFSAIIREPLAGLEAVLPVPETVVHTHASPRAAVGFLIHAAGLPRDALGPRVNLSMPGVCCTVAEQIASLRRIAGDRVAARIRPAEDPLVARIVAGWPQRIEARRARELGFKAENSFDEIVRIHIDEDRGGTFVD